MKIEVIRMFGIGLPELILILALALIVVGPDKLPDLARTVAKGVMDLKKTANTLKESLNEHGNPLDDIKPELEDAAKAVRDDVMMNDDTEWKEATGKEEPKEVIDVPPDTSSTETLAATEDATETKTSDQVERKS